MSQATGTLPNAFIGKPEMPTDDDLAAELGRSAKALWDRLLANLAERHHGERAILYLSPCHGCFRASFALGGKAVEAARVSDLPAGAIRIIDSAKRYAEGTAVRIEVKGPADIAVVLRLAAIKLAN